MRKITLCLLLIFFISCTNNKEVKPDEKVINNSQAIGFKIKGTQKCWQKITIEFKGPRTSEFAEENPFLKYRLNVEFTNGDEKFLVPGFYAADGMAFETGAKNGAVWKARFTPNKPGEWKFKASFREGENIAVNDSTEVGKALSFDGTEGTFTIDETDKNAPGFLSKGRLNYVGQRYLQFEETKDYFIKGGTDSPENFLAYHEFDNTPAKHYYKNHIRDWKEGNPTWKKGKGKGIIGALNYLASKKMNVAYFLVNNVMGDGDDTYMWTSRNERYRFDCSKLDQWEIVFQHFDHLGIMMHVVLQENENQNLLDSGFTDVQRKLFHRELIARFSHHLGITWNMGEENGPVDWYHNLGQSNKQRIAMAEHFRSLDPYNHLNVFHTFAYNPKLNDLTVPLLGNKSIDGVSLQIDKLYHIHDEVKKWIKKSKDSLHQWVVNNDEIGHYKTGVVADSVDIKHDSIRKYSLWGTYMAGGAGTEWYMGVEDLTVDDFRTRDKMWDQTRYALDFFKDFSVVEMTNLDNKVLRGKAWCLGKEGKTYIVHLRDGGSATLKLNNKDYGDYTAKWYNPRTGIYVEEQQTIKATSSLNTGFAPSKEDWVVVLNKV